jgi:acetolactate synthase-1/2/3 large subunit
MAQGAETWWREFQHKAATPSFPLKPQQVIATLAELLPEDSIIVADAGTPTPFIAAYFRSCSGRRVIIPRGYGGLGFALPAAIGAKLARPEATVVALMGDGSFGMTVGEFETLHRLGLSITVVQFSNGQFGWLKIIQERSYGRQFYQVDFSSDTDHAAIARGFGLTGMRVEHPGDLAPAIRQAIQSPSPTFVDLAVEPEMVEVPPVIKWQIKRR